ncbi:N-acetylmuramoyl-L-alanine amidase [Macrococcus sp. EM39E]|uniref:N-acetylmuramoyl-L-alanine amidase n=1 Tax=Macrococcus animalis TaxID=3395467 RepID=UPI0039BEA7D3
MIQNLIANVFDLTQKISHGFFGHWLTGNGAKDLVHSPIPSNWQRIKNTASFEPQAGDIAIWNNGTYGHTAIIINGNPDGDLMSFISVDQNWSGNGEGLVPAEVVKHNYNGFWGVIRPPYDDVKIEGAKKVKTLTGKTKTKKLNILLVAGHGKGYQSNDSGAVGNGTNERDFIRTFIVPNVSKYLKQVGHTVSYYGGNSMNQDLFQDTKYGIYVDSNNYHKYGMYWVAKQKYDVIIEFHLDASTNKSVSGGHVIIGTSLNADSIDIGIQNALKTHVGTIRNIDPRDNLLNVVTAKKLNLNYRLVELGFITSKKDMDYIKSNLQLFTKSIAEAIHGESIKGVSTQPVKITKKVVKKKPKAQPKVKAEPVKKVVKVKHKYKQTYIVKKGDNLWDIANTYKVTVDYLKKLNELKSDRIFIDQVLIIKK